MRKANLASLFGRDFSLQIYMELSVALLKTCRLGVLVSAGIKMCGSGLLYHTYTIIFITDFFIYFFTLGAKILCVSTRSEIVATTWLD